MRSWFIWIVDATWVTRYDYKCIHIQGRGASVALGFVLSKAYYSWFVERKVVYSKISELSTDYNTMGKEG